MTHLLILPEYTYAGHCTSGGSNKDWAACLAVELDEQQTTPPPVVGETDEVVYLSVFGPHGASLRLVPPKRLAMSAARRLFKQKCNEKDGEAYVHVDFVPFLPKFGSPLGLALTAPESVLGASGVAAAVPSSASPAAPALGYAPTVVKPISREKLQILLAQPGYGLTEKVNGERCLIRFDGRDMFAYNRRGQLMSAPPEGAEHLRRLDRPFVTDGEWMTRELAGAYVAFALLEWDAAPSVSLSYETGITTLERAMFGIGLLKEACSTPTLALALANSTVPNLALLVAAAGAVRGQQVFDAVQASGGEGVVVRKLFGGYEDYPLKFKFLDDIDVIVIGLNDGLAAGSLKLGLIRPSDGAVIEVGNVRSGLSDDDVNAVRKMFADGKRLVFSVNFVPNSTVDIRLVQPVTSMTRLRVDKAAEECTTDQFDAEKAELIARAKPFKGFTL